MKAHIRVFGGYSSSHLQRNAARSIADQVWVSTSGFSSMPAFLAALMTFGADRLLFSLDYPSYVAAADSAESGRRSAPENHINA
jgi:hypothetical protein